MKDFYLRIGENKTMQKANLFDLNISKLIIILKAQFCITAFFN